MLMSVVYENTYFIYIPIKGEYGEKYQCIKPNKLFLN